MWDKQANKNDNVKFNGPGYSLFSWWKREGTWKQVCVQRDLDITMNPKGKEMAQMYKLHADFHFRLSHTSRGADHDFYQDSCTSSTVNIYELKQL